MSGWPDPPARCRCVRYSRGRSGDNAVDPRCPWCEGTGYEPPLTPQRQLEAWQRGESLCPNTNKECCPDFSCCSPHLRVPQAVRDAFVAADRPGRERLLMTFLAALVADAGHTPYIAGQGPKE